MKNKSLLKKLLIGGGIGLGVGVIDLILKNIFFNHVLPSGSSIVPVWRVILYFFSFLFSFCTSLIYAIINAFHIFSAELTFIISCVIFGITWSFVVGLLSKIKNLKKQDY